MNNLISCTDSPIGAKSYSPVWSEAECGVIRIDICPGFGGIFVFFTKIMTKLKRQIIKNQKIINR